MNSITVFCGSSDGNHSIFKEEAYTVGKTLALQKINVVYGGAKVGLMGKVADGALENGGTVTGVLPRFLSTKEIAHTGLTELILVNTMHERKTKMNDLCDGIIALPGGFGTMEELFEILTWSQLGLHQKPIGLLNVNGFYDHLIALIHNMAQQAFLKDIHQDMLLVSDSIEELLSKMENYHAPETPKWIKQAYL
jgi:uncharacterized protein (TIGR00730 family)